MSIFWKYSWTCLLVEHNCIWLSLVVPQCQDFECGFSLKNCVNVKFWKVQESGPNCNDFKTLESFILKLKFRDYLVCASTFKGAINGEEALLHIEHLGTWLNNWCLEMSYDQASFIFGNGDILWIFFFFFSIEYGLKNSIDCLDSWLQQLLLKYNVDLVHNKNHK